MPLVGARNFNGQIAIISEYAPDSSLEDLLRQKGKLSVEESVEMTIGILGGLQHLHESGIIHRDLKPANILLDDKTSRLTDFGISRIISADSLSETIAGTWAYMAPECFDGKRNIQTDIWAVGVILYRMLTGNLPFPQKEQTSLIGSIVKSEPEVIPNDISKKLSEIVVSALCKDAAKRYQTADEMRSFLTDFYSSYDILFEFGNSKHTLGAGLPFDDDIYQKMKPHFASAMNPLEANAGNIKSKIKVAIAYLHTELGFTKNWFVENKQYFLRFVRDVVSGELILDANKPENRLAYEKANQINSLEFESPIYIYENEDCLSEETRITPILIPYRKGDKWGFCDTKKVFLVEPIYDQVEVFREDMAKIKKGNSQGFIDRSGNELITPSEKFYSFSEGLLAVSDNNKCGFVNKFGEEVIPLIYDGILNFAEGLAGVKINDKCGFIDKRGELKIALKYQELWLHSEGLAKVKLENKWGFVNQKGDEVINIKYEEAWVFSEDRCIVRLNGKRGFIDKNGYEIILPYNYISHFSEGLAAVSFNNKCGFIDKTGKQVIPLKYDTYLKFSEGLALVTLESKHGFVNYYGSEVVPLIYDNADSFSEDLALVMFNGNLFEKQGFINK